MSGCEQHRVEMSALLDGESQPGTVIEVLDHLVCCSACREYYRELRAFQNVIDELPVAMTETVTGTVLAEIRPVTESRTTEHVTPTKHVTRLRASAANHWGWNLAAVLVIAVGLTALLLRQPGMPVPTGAPQVATAARFAGRQVAMDDERFVALTGELLGADLRYQRRLYALLTDIGADDPLDEAPVAELLWRYRTLNDQDEADWYDSAIARHRDQGAVDNVGEVRAAHNNGGVLY